MTVATLAKTQRAAFMGAMCYLLSVSLILLICSKNGIPVVPYLAVEYHGPRILHAAVTRGRAVAPLAAPAGRRRLGGRVDDRRRLAVPPPRVAVIRAGIPVRRSGGQGHAPSGRLTLAVSATEPVGAGAPRRGNQIAQTGIGKVAGLPTHPRFRHVHSLDAGEQRACPSVTRPTLR